MRMLWCWDLTSSTVEGTHLLPAPAASIPRLPQGHPSQRTPTENPDGARRPLFTSGRRTGRLPAVYEHVDITHSEYQRHLTRGDAAAARLWIERSTLPEDDKADLTRFVATFPSLTYVKEDPTLLDRYAEADQVTLPQWFRDVRSTLAFVEPHVLVRVDDFQWYFSPRADDVEEIWYDLRPGCSGEEERDLFTGDSAIYPIGSDWDDGETHIGIDLENPVDRRIFDFHGEDLLDNKLDGRPVRGSLYPVFDSYAQLLAHVVEVRPLPGG